MPEPVNFTDHKYRRYDFCTTNFWTAYYTAVAVGEPAKAKPERHGILGE